MQLAEPAVENNETDHDLLENAFGPHYYLLLRIKLSKVKIKLEPLQRKELMELILERDHLDICRFVKKLRVQ